MGKIAKILGGGQQKAPTVPTVDPEAERRKAEAEAAAKANEQLIADARRKRQQKGLLAGDEAGTGGSVLASGGKTGGSVLASGGQ